MYKPLPSLTSFRLLKFSPPSKLQLIVCELEEAPEYEALSYTWGPPRNTPACKAAYGSDHDQAIGVDVNETICHENEEGERFTVISPKAYTVGVSLNLYEAVLAWVSEGLFDAAIHGKALTSKYLWVDALCINQTDMTEKAAQISLMKTIYANARRTVVWLGADDPGHPVYDQLIHIHTTVLDQIAEYRDKHNDSQWHKAYIEDDKLVFGDTGVSISVEMARDLYKFYAETSWMSRAWVVQEVVLAEEAQVLMSNTYIDIARFGLIHDIINPSMAGRKLEHYDGRNDGIGLEIPWLCTLRNGAKFRTDFGNDYLDLLFYLFGSGTKRYVTDPRDAIFAYLGLAATQPQDGAQHYQPNYTCSAKWIYKHFTLWALRTSTEPLSFSRGHWVPDYNNLRKPLRYRWGQKPNFLAANEEFDIRYDGTMDDGVFAMEGRRCGRITAVLKPPDKFDTSEGGQYIMNCLNFIRDKHELLGDLLRTMTFSIFEEGLEQKLLNLMIRSCYLIPELGALVEEFKLWEPGTLEPYDKIVRASLAGQELTAQQHELWTELEENIVRPSMVDDNFIYVTDKDYVGRVYDAKIGDEIWLLCGARLPFVLRPVGEKHMLISETFMPGAMYGELLENGIAGERELITFVD